MSEKVCCSIPEEVLDGIYIAMLDVSERLSAGTANLKRCLNYLETKWDYKPPTGYLTSSVSEEKTYVG